MKKTLIRTLLVAIVIAFGVVLVLALSYMGKETSGPVEDFFARIGSAISRVENKFILSKREKTRSKGLAWLNEYKYNFERLKNPQMLFVGAYDDKASETFQEIVDLEDTLHTTFPLIHIYTAWGSKREQKFPARNCQIISAIGSIPVITWEPWLTDFNKELLPGIPDESIRDIEGLKAISRGVYDTYIDTWAADAKAFGKSIFVRFGHEMNDPYRYPWGPQNNAPEDFIAAWRHVVERFRLAGADNVLWVWSPHPAYGLFTEYFPGSDVVDWVGVGAL
jgi:ABC-type antimicrobial peptide transport system permease subunit